MRFNSWNWFFTLFLCMTPFCGHAADLASAPTSASESFATLLDRMLASDLRYQRELAGLEGESVSVLSMKKAWEPKVDLQIQRTVNRTFGTTLNSETFWTTQADVTAGWNLYAFGLDQTRQDFIEKQRLRIIEARSLKRLEAEQRAVNVILDYIEASQLVQIAKKQQSNRLRLLQVQEKRKNLGLTAGVDLDILRVNLVASDLLASDTEQILAVKKAEITQAIGDFEAPGSWPLDSEFYRKKPRLESWFDRNKDAESKVLRADRGLIVEREAALAVAKKTNGPSFDLIMQLSRGLNNAPGEQLPQSYVALAFNMPLLDRGEKLQASSNAQVQIKDSQYSYDYDRNKLAVDLISSQKMAIHYLKNIEKIDEMVDVAEKIYNVNQARYGKALINQTELYQSEVLFYGSQESKIASIKKWYQQVFSVCFIIGQDAIPCLKSI